MQLTVITCKKKQGKTVSSLLIVYWCTTKENSLSEQYQQSLTW